MNVLFDKDMIFSLVNAVKNIKDVDKMVTIKNNRNNKTYYIAVDNIASYKNINGDGEQFGEDVIVQGMFVYPC
jgi:hypothetical protein